MQNRAFSACQQVLTLSLGIGGMLNVLCVSVSSQTSTDLSTDIERFSQATQRSKALRSPVTQTPALPSPVAQPISLSSAFVDVVVSPVEDLDVPQLSAVTCQQTVCLSVPVSSALSRSEAIGPETSKAKALTEQVNLQRAVEEQADLEETVLEEDEAAETPRLELEEVLLETSNAASDLIWPPVGIALEASIEIPSAAIVAQARPAEVPDFLSDIVDDNAPEPDADVLDDELGTLRLQQTRSRNNEELGILRLLQTSQAPPPPPSPPIAFLGGRLGFFNTDNVFRSEASVEEQIYQSGLSLYLFPKLSDKTNLYAIATTNLARYEIDYNEIELQAGLRHRLLPSTFVQVGWRNQKLYTPGYREKLLGINYLDALISHRRLLSKRAWVDGFYQLRLGFADPAAASRFRQTLITSINYAATPKLRTSLLYQLDLDDYLKIDRYDVSQQLLGVISYNITPESRISLFGGSRFGNSSAPGVDLDDLFYGAGLNINLPLF